MVVRELSDMKQQLNKINEIKQNMDQIEISLKSCATSEELVINQQLMKEYASKKELIWLADMVQNKAESKDVANLKLRFSEVD